MKAPAKKVTSDSEIAKWVDEAKRLRSSMFEDEARFYLFLVDGEAGGVDWRGAYSNFTELVEEICDVTRYVSFRDALAKVPREHASQIGVDGVIKSAAIVDSTKRSEVVASLSEARARRGMPLSSREVSRVVQQMAPVSKPTRDLLHLRQRDVDEREAPALRLEIERLRKENDRLKAEVAKLKKLVKK